MPDLPFLANFLCGPNPTNVGWTTTSTNPHSLNITIPQDITFRRLRVFVGLTDTKGLWPKSAACDSLSFALPVKELQSIVFEYAKFDLCIALNNLPSQSPSSPCRLPEAIWTESMVSNARLCMPWDPSRLKPTILPPKSVFGYRASIPKKGWGATSPSELHILDSLNALPAELPMEARDSGYWDKFLSYLSNTLRYLHNFIWPPSSTRCCMILNRDMHLDIRANDRISFCVQSTEPCNCYISACVDLE
jgi:hypothetical protein